ncbi:hypothetical protein IEC97_28160 [Neobacillus cucumis]|uniref:hypothetical protein n=1 Tax=Neobacillus cucumis TaxID=1740721 RepID=UPI0018DF6AF6|nr:hypothetical protein [Neobacillus cucumis]MBI0581193.1 hypothetical protein [Neobacillus cucumis]
MFSNLVILLLVAEQTSAINRKINHSEKKELILMNDSVTIVNVADSSGKLF